MAYYITFCCFTNNIFFIKYIPIMVMVFTFVMMFVTFMVVVLTVMVMFVTFVIVVLTFMVMFVTFLVVVLSFMLMFVAFVMMFITYNRFPIFIFINKVEMVSMAHYITFCCFTNNIFFIKYIAIMVMIMVFTFVVVMFAIVFMVLTFVFMVFCSYYWISLFIFKYKMEMVPVSYDISCFCLTNNIFFIKYIPIFFMMFIRY